MAKFDVVKAWIDNVAYSHSKSENTEQFYRIGLTDFYQFIDSTPEQTLKEYEGMTDREFRRKYAQYLRAFISQLSGNGYAINTMKAKVTAVRSFFKYNDLPLGYVPLAKSKVMFHNRDIAKEEIVEILKVSRARDRAFFCMMAQSGLRPFTLCSLKLKHIEPEFSEGKIPCKIEVPEEIAKGEFGSYFTFMGEESIEHLKEYLNTRSGIGPEDYLFTSHGSDKQLNRKSMSGIFIRAIEKLKEKGLLDFEQKEHGKPRNVRLYNLRKFFRKYAQQAGIEYVNFWMGHRTDYKAPHIPASDAHYFSREDVEAQRKLYKEKAMPYLRLETGTPGETEQTIMDLTKKVESRDHVIEELRQKLKIVDDVEEKLKSIDTIKEILELWEVEEKLDDEWGDKFEKFLGSKYPKKLLQYRKILDLAGEFKMAAHKETRETIKKAKAVGAKVEEKKKKLSSKS